MLHENNLDSIPNDCSLYELSALSYDVYNIDRLLLPNGWTRKLWKEYPSGLAAAF